MTLYVELALTFKYCIQVTMISLKKQKPQTLKSTYRKKKSHLKSFIREWLHNNLYFSKVKVSSIHFNRYNTNKKKCRTWLFPLPSTTYFKGHLLQVLCFQDRNTRQRIQPNGFLHTGGPSQGITGFNKPS